ncbi:MAG: NAD(+)/NADH kinase [Clostridia bacterium]|nr:NAD(+)/NADH kinase [Clostridia bacterium]
MIGFFFRENNARSIKAVEELKKLFDEVGYTYRDIFDDDNFDKDCSDIELFIVFGGDGSVLRATKLALDKIPIIAINTGNLGFLTSYEEGELKRLVEDIKSGSVKYSNRRLMKIICNGNVYYALNDAVIVKNYAIDSASECVKLHFYIDNEHVDTYVADGLIISTPTGSTAYALSAGAPIVTPRVDALVAAPICAHSLHSRPIVFASFARPEIIVDKNTKECALYVDGAITERIPCGGNVVIEKGDISVKICDFAEKFFEKLSQKLNIWSTSDRPKN